MELLAAVEGAVLQGIPLAVVLPLPGTAAPLLLGAASLVGAVLRTRSLAVEVAVASTNLTSRTLYDRLYFENQRLADFIPRGSVDFDGAARLVGKPARDGGGRLYLINQLSRLDSWGGRLAALVIDASAATPAAVARTLRRPDLSAAIVYLTADPFDPALAVVRNAGGLIWGWDAPAIADLAGSAIGEGNLCVRPLVAEVELLASAGTSDVVVWGLDDGERSDLDDALAALWRALGQLSGAYRMIAGSVYGASEATRWVWSVHNSLTSLPVSPRRYDAQLGSSPYAVRLGESVSTARAFARNVGGEAGQLWYEVANALDAALDAADQEEKLGRVLAWLNERVAENVPATLVLRNRAAVNAVTTALEESPASPVAWPNVVSVATIADVTAGRARMSGVGEICLPGPLPRSRSGLLALPPASRVRVIAAGPFEVRRAEKQAISSRAALSAIRAEAVRKSAVKLGVPAEPSEQETDGSLRVYVLSSGRATAMAPMRVGDGRDNPWEPFDLDIVAMLQRTIASGGSADDETQAVAPARVRGSAATSAVEVLAVSIRMGEETGILLAEPNDLITRRRGQAVQRVAAKSLVPEDVVVLVDRAARHDLLAAVTEKLSESPAYAPLAQLVAFWKARAARLRDSNLTYRDILLRMRGTSLTSEQTIGTWVRGVVDGPQKPEDVRRFAEAVNDVRLLREAERVGWALKTLHAVHRRIGRWLSAQIAGIQIRRDEGLVDADLGIHVSDLLESVTTHTVISIDRAVHRVPANAVGLVLPQPDALRLLNSTF
ncbi:MULTISPECIES: DISARM anti-phage system protein DrmE domain-containing protein [Nocardia]|uniref:DISARM anti-phage system protein DrmE domain-containing protein n=1 Tax=Nocardia abscessus TaxID=120957 RepID=UPI002457AF9E|nr:hypothetical protein [Nocardia abscessus]